jgi:hypothetical protein
MTILPFRKKPNPPAVPSAPSRAAISMKDCRFENNGVGVLVGGNVEIDMTNTSFVGNGIGVVAGNIDEQILQALGQLPVSDRFVIAGEIGEISRAGSAEQREEIIRGSTLANRLSVVANAATIAQWISGVVTGLSSTVGLDRLVRTLMG